eukprot:3820021-Rhodomonas_salina.3
MRDYSVEGGGVATGRTNAQHERNLGGRLPAFECFAPFLLLLSLPPRRPSRLRSSCFGRLTGSHARIASLGFQPSRGRLNQRRRAALWVQHVAACL